MLFWCDSVTVCDVNSKHTFNTITFTNIAAVVIKLIQDQRLNLKHLRSSDPNLLLSQQSSSDGDEQLGWIKNNDAAPDKRSSILSSSLSDLLQAMGAQRNTRDESSLSEEKQRSWLDSFLSSRPLGGERVRSLDLGWLREDRRRRNYSLGLAGLCCNQGCTKNDIGRLCWGWRDEADECGLGLIYTQMDLLTLLLQKCPVWKYCVWCNNINEQNK